MNTNRLEYFESYRPHEKQLPFHKSRKRVKALIAGARGGKTKAGCMEVGKDAIIQPDYQEIDIQDGKPYQILAVAPTYPMLERILIPEYLRIFPACIRVGKKYNDSKKLLQIQGTRGHSLIHFVSADKAEKIEGMQIYRAHVDEFLQIKESFYNEVKTRLSDRLGTCILSGTPKGKNWGYRRIYQEAGNDAANIHCSYYKTSDNPYFPKEELIEARASMPLEYYLRTFEASFDVFEGQVYKSFSRHVHVIDEIPAGTRIVKCFAGHDFGFSAPMVTLFILKDSNNNYYVVSELYETGYLNSIWAEDIKDAEKDIKRRYYCELDVVWCDEENPEGISTFKRNGVPARPAAKGPGSVLAGIEHVAELFHVNAKTRKPRIYILKRCKNTIDQIESYQWKKNKLDVEIEEPIKENDHCPDALRYAITMEDRRAKKATF